MTRYDIIRMAEQSQMNLCWGDVVFTGTNNLERFAALVVAHEREACARVCEAYKFAPAAEAIRARGNT